MERKGVERGGWSTRVSGIAETDKRIQEKDL